MHQSLSLSLIGVALLAGIVAGVARAEPVAIDEKATFQQLPQIRGFTIQLSDPDGLDKYLKAIDDLANMGCNWVNFVIAARQYDVKAESISIIWPHLPLPPDIKRILWHAKARGMHVMLMPIILLDNAKAKEWRGVINPPDWDLWFASYASCIRYVVQQIAIPYNVDVFCVGSELLSTESFRDRWCSIIAEIRHPIPSLDPDRHDLPYTGKLTYSANWDHYDHGHGGPAFWDKLDYIGMNSYNELADRPGASIAELDRAWLPIKNDILEFVAEQKKPFFFTEVGWHNLENTILAPWNYAADGPIDNAEQTHAFKSFVDTWSTVPRRQFMGAFIWEWRPGADGAKDHGTYSLQNTDALKIVHVWMLMK